MRICMISGEANPFLKTGGLGDVVYSLSRKLVVFKHPTTIIMPYYPKIKEDDKGVKIEKVCSFNVKMNWRNQVADIYETTFEGINYYFISNEAYFLSRPNAYGYDDDNERFAFFQLAACKLIEELKLPFEIIHVHDWQASMVPLIYKTQFEKKWKKRPKFILTIHNSLFLGYASDQSLFDYFNINPMYYDNGLTRFNNQLCYLKTGIMTADKVTTVSPTHAKELILGWDGSGLQDVFKIREADLEGILNGIDLKEWNPNTDPYLYKNYTKENVISSKAENKKQFCLEKGFTHPEYPLFVLVSRLSYQKGIDVITDSIKELISQKANIYILGTGQEDIENQLSFLSEHYKGQLVVDIKFSSEDAHKAYASGDFFFIPSRYEPCGLTQMYSHRYGTLPLARSTGGLIDSIIPYNGTNEKIADGLLFQEYSKHAFLCTVQLALDLYKKKRTLTRIIHNAMDVNHSWTNSYKEYKKMYDQVLGRIRR